MSRKKKDNAFWRTLVILLLGGIVEGCLSANPAADIAKTASLANDRKGVDDELENLWAKPWQDRAAGWNGGTALDVNTAVQAALSNDPALRRNLARVAGARANLSQASLPPNPVVNMAFGSAIDGMAGRRRRREERPGRVVRHHGGKTGLAGRGGLGDPGPGG